MRLFFVLLSMLTLSVACSSPKAKYVEEQEEAREEYDESMKEAQEEYKEDSKQEAVEYVEDSDGATINKDENQVDVEE